MKKKISLFILVLLAIYSIIYFSLNLNETNVDSDVSGKNDASILEVGELSDVGIKYDQDKSDSGDHKEAQTTTRKIKAVESQVELPSQLPVEVNLDVVKSSDATVQQEYFTIQIFSYKSLKKALVTYEKVEKALGEENVNLDQLRVEHIKEFYAIRIGKCEERESCVLLSNEIREQFNDLFILSAYIIPERIEKIYQINDLAPGPDGLNMR